VALPAEASRRFTSKLNSIIDKRVKVILVDGKSYTGRLYAIDNTSLNLILESVNGEEGEIPLLIISGSRIAEILLEEEGVFDAKEFAEFAAQHGIPRHLIRVHEDIGVVEVGRGIRVTKDGVEGAGMMAQRLFTLYREYLRRKGVKP